MLSVGLHIVAACMGSGRWDCYFFTYKFNRDDLRSLSIVATVMKSSATVIFLGDVTS
jgi:hypothetical protein